MSGLVAWIARTIGEKSVVEFPSYEAAQANNDLAATGEFAGKIAALAQSQAFRNLDVIRETVLRSGSEAWDPAYALYNGNLLLGDHVKTNRKGVVYLQVEIQVVQQGAVELRLVAPGAKTFWIDDRELENQKPTVTLAPGRHKITVRAQAEYAASPFARDPRRSPALPRPSRPRPSARALPPPGPRREP